MLFRCLKFDEEISLKIETVCIRKREKSDEDTAKAKYQDFMQEPRRSPIKRRDSHLYRTGDSGHG